MHTCNNQAGCNGCSARMICRCLQVTEEMLDALIDMEIRSLEEIREATGAGDGCTACRRRIRQYLERRSQEALSPASS